MNEVLYVGFYAPTGKNNENRNCCLAAVNLMNYVARTISKFAKVVIVSPSWTLDTKGRYRSTRRMLDANIFLQTCPTIGFGNRISKAFVYALSLGWLFLYLLRGASRNSTVVVYHSPWLYIPIVLSKAIRRFKLVLQVCEIYQDAAPLNSFMRYSENALIAAADSFVLSTGLLRARVNRKGKPACICAGVYEMEQKRSSPPQDRRTHLVYSGIIDQVKKGAFTAVRAAEYLDDRYHTHIIGFGRQEDISSLQDMIATVNTRGRALVTYDGLKDGDEFSRFLQTCHIGYSTQCPDHEFNRSSFPAKIFSYLSNGLRVVSVSTAAIRESYASRAIHFYEHDEPSEIARVVRGIDLQQPGHEEATVREMDRVFSAEVRLLLETQPRAITP